MAKRTVGLWVFLIILGFVILANVAGLVIEILKTVGVIQTDLVNIRSVAPVSFTLSLAFVVLSVIVWIYAFRRHHRTILMWHILMGVGALSLLYKLIAPTYLTLLVPFYVLIALAVTALVWGGMFMYFRRLDKKHRLEA